MIPTRTKVYPTRKIHASIYLGNPGMHPGCHLLGNHSSVPHLVGLDSLATSDRLAPAIPSIQLLLLRAPRRGNHRPTCRACTFLMYTQKIYVDFMIHVVTILLVPRFLDCPNKSVFLV